MTYSNRPSGSPFQHRSQFDKNPQVDNCIKMNPFLDNMPGTWSSPYKADKPMAPPKDADKGLDDPEPSPICDWATTWGDNTVAVCNPPYKFAPKVSCPMSRPLEPQRNIDPGMWYYNRLDKENNEKSEIKLFTNISLVLLAIIVLLNFLPRK